MLCVARILRVGADCSLAVGKVASRLGGMRLDGDEQTALAAKLCTRERWKSCSRPSESETETESKREALFWLERRRDTWRRASCSCSCSCALWAEACLR